MKRINAVSQSSPSAILISIQGAYFQLDSNYIYRLVPYPIPANDDGVVGVELIANILADACLEGVKVREQMARINEGRREDGSVGSRR